MYFYLYDAFLQDKKYAKVLAEIDARLIDLSIQGRTSRLTILNETKELITDAVKRGADTVVILGDDKTVTRAISAIAELDVALGVIPIGANTAVARYLGIPEGVAACEVLSKRVRESIDIGKAGSNYFAFYLRSMSPHVKIVSPLREYALTLLSDDAEIFVCNFLPHELEREAPYPASFFVPRDGKLELVVKERGKNSLIDRWLFQNADEKREFTILPFTTLRIEADTLERDVRLVLDNDKVIKPPIDITVLPHHVSVIVGKDRMF